MSPSDGPIDLALCTALSTLGCGLAPADGDAVTGVVVMVEHAEARLWALTRTLSSEV